MRENDLRWPWRAMIRMDWMGRGSCRVSHYYWQVGVMHYKLIPAVAMQIEATWGLSRGMLDE